MRYTLRGAQGSMLGAAIHYVLFPAKIAPPDSRRADFLIRSFCPCLPANKRQHNTEDLVTYAP